MTLKLKLQYFGLPDAKNQLTGKDWCWERLRAGVEVGTEDEMVGWHHGLNGPEIEQTLGIVKDREAWCAAVHGVVKRQTGLSD